MGKSKVVLSVILVFFIFTLSGFQSHAEGMDDFSVILQQALYGDGGLTKLVWDGGKVNYITSTDLETVFTQGCTQYPLPGEYDLDGDGIVSVDDLTNFFKMVDTSYLYTIKGSLDGNRDAKEQVYEMLIDRFDVSDVSEISSCTLKTFLENYSYCVCLYSLVTGESINSFVNGELLYTSISDRSDTTENWYAVQGIFFDNYLLGKIDTNLVGKEFPRSEEQASDNWAENTGNSQHTSSGDEVVEDPLLVKDDVSDWLNELVNGGVTDEGTDLPDGSDLSYADRIQLGAWVAKVSSDKSDAWFTTLRVARIIFGILCIVYAVLFFLSYWLDKMNNLIDISLLSLISLGKFIASADDNISTYKEKGSEPKLVTFKDVMFISGGILALGVLILSGALFKIVVIVIDKVNYLLGGN